MLVMLRSSNAMLAVEYTGMSPELNFLHLSYAAEKGISALTIEQIQSGLEADMELLRQVDNESIELLTTNEEPRIIYE